jgi:hypothetical protein
VKDKAVRSLRWAWGAPSVLISTARRRDSAPGGRVLSVVLP